MKKFALVGALATLTITTAACGGGGSDRLSEREYVRSLEDLCTQVTEDLEDLDLPEDISDYARFGEDALDITSDGLDELRELTPPEDLQDLHDDYVASIENTIELTEDFIAAAEDEDEDELADVQSDLEDENLDRNDIAEEIGADDCVDDSEEPDEPVDPTVPETTEPDVPETTEPDVPETTEPDVPEPDDPSTTIPRITVPPIDMTMPPETEPPVVQGSDIGTIDFDDLDLPSDYTFTNTDSESLTTIQNLYAEQFSGQIEAIGGALAVDNATGERFSVYVFFWFDDLVDSGNGIAFVDDLASATDVIEHSEPVTPGGLVADHLAYDDGTEALIVWGGTLSVVGFGDVGSQDSLATLMDAMLG